MTSHLTPTALLTARTSLAAALDGSGPPVEFTEDGRTVTRPEARETAAGSTPGVAAVVRTSGSTGTPKQTLLTGEALAASSTATAARLGGEGHWLLALSLHYVAGLAVLSRSIHAGTTPTLLPPGTFTPERFAEAARQLPGTGFQAVSLVPTQLARLLDPAAGTLGVEALRRFDAILIGGARTPDLIRERAAEADLPLHLTYGMSETCGGCVYDGVPLDGVHADLVPDPESGTPRLRLSGPMVAAGYLSDPLRTATHFGTGTPADPTARWYLTEDTGTVTNREDGTPLLTVTGRVDDVINTGGIKVSAARIQQVLEQVPGVHAAFAAGLPDDDWGHRVCAAVALGSGEWDERGAAEAIRAELGPAAVPKTWLTLEELPLLANGKTDRQALIARFADQH